MKNKMLMLIFVYKKVRSGILDIPIGIASINNATNNINYVKNRNLFFDYKEKQKKQEDLLEKDVLNSIIKFEKINSFFPSVNRTTRDIYSSEEDISYTRRNPTKKKRNKKNVLAFSTHKKSDISRIRIHKRDLQKECLFLNI
jgi:hypothetical protein